MAKHWRSPYLLALEHVPLVEHLEGVDLGVLLAAHEMYLRAMPIIIK